MEQVSNLITQRLKTLTEAEDYHFLQSRHKAITALFPYAVRQEQDGRPELLDAILHAARASKERQLTWNRIIPAAVKLFSGASPRGIILASPHIPWCQLTDGEDVVQRWVTAVSAVQYSDNLGESVVDVLLHIASVEGLASSIPVDVWSWLTKRPPLSLTCLGRYVGTRSRVVKAVRALKDVEVLKSYFLLVWSESDDLRDHRGFDGMCASIREDLSGAGMSNHRTELIQRLDHVLGELDRGLAHLMQHNPDLGKYDLWKMKRRYKKLRELLLEAEKRTSSQMTALSPMLTHAPCDIHAYCYPPMLLHARSFPQGTPGLSYSPARSVYADLGVPRFAMDPPPFSLRTFATFVGCVFRLSLQYVALGDGFCNYLQGRSF